MIIVWLLVTKLNWQAKQRGLPRWAQKCQLYDLQLTGQPQNQNNFSNESQQAVEEKEMTMESMDSRWQKETVTLLPSIESVSSTAMVMQVKNDVFFL